MSPGAGVVVSAAVAVVSGALSANWVFGRHRNCDDKDLNYWIFSDLTLSQGDLFDANKVFSWDIGHTRYFANCLGGIRYTKIQKNSKQDLVLLVMFFSTFDWIGRLFYFWRSPTSMVMSSTVCLPLMFGSHFTELCCLEYFHRFIVIKIVH